MKAGEEIIAGTLIYEKDGKMYMVRCKECNKPLRLCICDSTSLLKKQNKQVDMLQLKERK